ncbi:MAG TPA: response regulator [bacterium]|nr:response regulator [bacterium]
MGCILVIEDDVDYRILLKDALEVAGFSVLTASDGNDGLRRMTQGRCDVVITDMLMPEKEGFETIMELKRLKPDVHIIAISGGGRSGRGDDLLRHAKLFGAHHTMAKPIILKDLVALVRTLMPA